MSCARLGLKNSCVLLVEKLNFLSLSILVTGLEMFEGSIVTDLSIPACFGADCLCVSETDLINRPLS